MRYGALARLSARLDDRRRGTVFVAAAATLWGINGSLVHVLLSDGLSPARIAEARVVVTALLTLGFAIFKQPADLLISTVEVPRLMAYGVIGVAGTDGLSAVAIKYLDVAAAIVIQFTAPLLLLCWVRFVHGRRLSHRVWLMSISVLSGCFFLVGADQPQQLSTIGVAAAVGSAVTLAVYVSAGERLVRERTPLTAVAWASIFASIFWLVVAPPWSFPFHAAVAAALPLLCCCIFGAALPALMMASGLASISAPRAAIVSTLEPVVAAAVALVFLDQSLTSSQLAGGAIVVLAIVLLERLPVTADERTPHA